MWTLCGVILKTGDLPERLISGRILFPDGILGLIQVV